MIIPPYKTVSPEGKKYLNDLLDRFQPTGSQCKDAVSEIIANVRENGEAAVLQYTRKFDSPEITGEQLKVSREELDAAESQVAAAIQETLDFAIERIRTFHLREKEESWTITGDHGTITGRLVNPVDSAGLYVPGGQGGQTPLVSSVLMNGIPAVIAGVKRIVLVTPADKHGKVNPALLLAAKKIGIREIYKIGSAWAIASLAYGTQNLRPVDVIVGPGNQYVTEAKRQVSGRVRIDMIAGPSEVLIVADETAHPAYIAADMLAQAEHDPQALAMVVTTSKNIATQVNKELEIQLGLLSRQSIARTSLKDRGVILIAEDLDEAVEIANKIAAEHLELMVADPQALLSKIRHAGAIFLGDHSPEAAGDYVAGPNHVLPTMGTARFSSALGVETFQKKSSIISYSREQLVHDAQHILRLAGLEGLTAHARSVSVRLDNPPSDK
ncbi:MAG: histidinol dehydrogenase [Proteobacteria bacterium]|nr:histidinol dehydrogenase [Pseudomonadota bacterium]MBU1711172.1 histidinol dehydrogenase [Pseudomonadota bacterium]